MIAADAGQTSTPLATLAVPDQTRAVTRGVGRLFGDLGCGVLTEFTLKIGRRADLVALDAKGVIHLVEVKVTVADFRGDDKWTDYVAFCDRFYFAVPPTFPREILPAAEACGIIVADGYGGEVLRPAPVRGLAAARRKAVTLSFARQASQRLHGLQDPRL